MVRNSRLKLDADILKKLFDLCNNLSPLKKIDYYNICKVLKVSPSTVAKFSLLMERSEGIVPTFSYLVKKEKIGEFLEELFNDLYAPGVPGVNWKAAWQRKRDLERRKTYGM